MSYQSTDKPVTNCWKECHKSGGRIKYPCGVCQSCIDIKRAADIFAKHKYGRFCKGSDNNHCGMCAYIKWHLELLRHLSGSCYKRCQYCRGAKVWHGSMDLVRGLYKAMLRLKDGK